VQHHVTPFCVARTQISRSLCYVQTLIAVDNICIDALSVQLDRRNVDGSLRNLTRLQVGGASALVVLVCDIFCAASSSVQLDRRIVNGSLRNLTRLQVGGASALVLTFLWILFCVAFQLVSAVVMIFMCIFYTLCTRI
jgi:hypothetical protein